MKEITKEEKDAAIARAIRSPEGYVMLSDAMLGLPQDPYWLVRIRAIPVRIRWTWRKIESRIGYYFGKYFLGID